MSGSIRDQVVVVTGAARGVGELLARKLAARGARVALVGLEPDELARVARELGARYWEAVVTDSASMTRVAAEIAEVYGRIDVLVANAGIGEFAPLASLTEEHFDKLFDLNVKGTLFTVQKALTLMNDGGSIILIGSVASVKGTPAFGTYGATKAAVRNLVRAWTMELKDRRIRSNVLSPGPIKTPLVDLQPPDAMARILSTIPMGRMGEPDEVAKAALFLASDDSSFVTGIELFVDGGRGQV